MFIAWHRCSLVSTRVGHTASGLPDLCLPQGLLSLCPATLALGATLPVFSMWAEVPCVLPWAALEEWQGKRHGCHHVRAICPV